MRRQRLDGAQQLLALLAHHDEHGSYRRDLAFRNDDLQHRARVGGRDLDRRLVGLDLDERLVLLDPVTLGHQPAGDLALGQALTEIGQPELARHGPVTLLPRRAQSRLRRDIGIRIRGSLARKIPEGVRFAAAEAPHLQAPSPSRKDARTREPACGVDDPLHRRHVQSSSCQYG